MKGNNFFKRARNQGLKRTFYKGLDKVLWYIRNWKSLPAIMFKKISEIMPSFLPKYLNPNDIELKEIEKSFRDIPFSRKYDVRTLKSRILNLIEDNGMSFKVYVLKNGKNLEKGIYCHFVLEIIKE